jgi:hypothetical protein
MRVVTGVPGKSSNNRSSTTCPRNPVTPVRKIRLPASASTIEAFSTTRQIMLLYHAVGNPGRPYCGDLSSHQGAMPRERPGVYPGLSLKRMENHFLR